MSYPNKCILKTAFRFLWNKCRLFFIIQKKIFFSF